jgi:uncharacterized repeat protein (TIGR01451 family)
MRFHQSLRLTANSPRIQNRFPPTRISAAVFCVLSALASDAWAGQTTDCPMVKLGNPSGNICNAGDVSVATAVVGPDNIGAYCFPGEQFAVNIEADILVRNQTRWDIGVWISQDGKPLNVAAASGGAEFCEVVPMPPSDEYSDNAGPGDPPSVSSFDTNPDATPNSQDACGDTNGISNPDPVSGILLTYGDDPAAFHGPVTLNCVAGPSGGVVLESMVSWNQSDPGICDPTNTDTYSLDNTSKCSVGSNEIAVDIVGRLTVTKSAPGGAGQNFDFAWTNDSPPFDSTLNPALNPFTLQDGESEEIYAVIGDGTAKVTVTEQNLPADWTLESIVCTGDDVTPVVVNGGEITVTLSYDTADPAASQADVSCTYNNVEIQPALSLVKSTTTPDYNAEFNTIDYGYLVSNSGNVPLNFPVQVSDNRATVTCPPDDGGDPNNGDAVLDPGESISCSAVYTVSQADVDAGAVTNLAFAEADGVQSNTDTVTVPAVQNPLLSVVKSSLTALLSEPQTVVYGYLVSNDGNVTLTGIALSDDNDADDMVCPSSTLSPTQTMTCSASHVFSQGELDANGSPLAGSGLLSNTVTATSDQAPTAQDALDIPIVQTPGLTVLKSGAWNDDGTNPGVAEPGETVSYTVSVTNSGNTTLAPVTVQDPLITDPPNSGSISCPGGNPIPSLDPGEGVDCTATYTLVDSDISAGQVDNMAAASSGDTSDTDDETVLLPNSPGLSLVKTGLFNDESGDGFGAAGETITYTFVVTNDGNTVTLTNVSVTDPKVSPIDCSPESNPIADLAPGESVQCSGDYTLTQDDVDAGRVENTASAISDQVGPATDDETVLLPQDIAWDITKSGAFQDESGDGLAQPGESIAYTITVQNTGKVTITNVVVTDSKIDPVSCPGGNPIPLIAPGASVDCTGSYLLTQADIDSGQVVNVAIADPDETPPDSSEVTTPLPQGAAMTIEKTSGTVEVTAPGPVLYSYLVTNTGNITLTGVTLADDNDEDDLVCPASNLAPAESMTCNASHDVTQDELDVNGSPVADSGVLYNVVTGGATELGETVSDDLSIPIVLSASMTVQKNSATEEITEEGPVSYAYLVTNTGSVTLTGITLADDNIDGTVDCGGTDTLDPGANMTCTAVHTVTSQELENNGSPDPDSGVLHNVVVASSNEAEDVTDNLSIPIRYSQLAVIRVTKDFTDDFPGEVTVQLTCNAGLPLQQKFVLSDGERVDFSVYAFEPGEMDCSVEEIIGLPGYAPSYMASDPDGAAEDARSEPEGCYFDGISGGTLFCDISNDPTGFTYQVTKVWENLGAVVPPDTMAEVVVECENVWIDGSIQSASTVFTFYSPDKATQSFSPGTANPDVDGAATACRAVEVNVGASAVETDQGCAEAIVFEFGGDTIQGCTITNSVFFEGIPVLGRTGSIILALLLLGVGLVGYRRLI